MKISVYIARHGEAEINKNPHQNTGEDTLTDLGKKQALFLAKRFCNTSIEQIYTSKISRARLTAHQVSEMTHTPITILESLKERKMIYTDHQTYTPEERYEDFKERLVDAKTFLENLPHQSVLLISHALFIKGLLASILLDEFLTETNLDKTESALVIDHAAITKLIFNTETRSWKILYLNNTHHLS